MNTFAWIAWSILGVVAAVTYTADFNYKEYKKENSIAEWILVVICGPIVWAAIVGALFNEWRQK